AGALLLHPPFNIALLTARDRQRSWRNVIFNDGARARIRAVADVDRGDEHGVGTGAHVAADGGVVLIYSVIIYKHGGGTNIGFLTDGGITNVSQVRNLGTATNLGVFSFHESAQLAVLTQLGIGTDEGKRSDLGVGANDRFFAVGANHTCPAPDLHVSQGGNGLCALDAQNLDSLVVVSACFFQSLLAVEHAGAGGFAQCLYISSSVVRHSRGDPPCLIKQCSENSVADFCKICRLCQQQAPVTVLGTGASHISLFS